MTESRQSYDPYRLIDDVTQLLEWQGLKPHVEAGKAGEALGGAGMLLRALGIAPLTDPLDPPRRRSPEISWPDRDDKRAAG